MKFTDYIRKFNAADEETVVNAYPNAVAEQFLTENAPQLSCPDELIEETFAFREWTLRKHFRRTEDGTVITEFLPNVTWAGKYNTINAAVFHHLNETRWLANCDEVLDYIQFWLDEKGDSYKYFTPAIYELYKFALVTDNWAFIEKNIDKIERNLLTFEAQHILPNGLFWSLDNYDAMEISISGCVPKEGESGVDSLKGIRPTLNSYMYGGYTALSEIFARLGNGDKAAHYADKAAALKEKYNEKFFNGDFYKALHLPEDALGGDGVSYLDIPPALDVREQIGYIPFIYGLGEGDKAKCFKYMFDEKVFAAKTGLATAEISHPRYLYEYAHECLWNGYVWPFATAQTITGLINSLNRGDDSGMTNRDLYEQIVIYAKQHYDYSTGEKRNFIDEVMSPDEYVWYARKWLQDRGFPARKGGYERGKDYNHSTFIDLVIRGLIGVNEDGDTLTVNPRIEGVWDWFSLENFTFKHAKYNIYYDADGTHFGKGAGVRIEKI